MPFQFTRVDRLNEEVRREVDRIIREDVHDPRVTGTFSITRAEVTRDLRYAKVYVSVFEPELRQPLLAALKGAAGFIRRTLGKAVQAHYTPELLFELDTNIEYGARMASLIDAVVAADRRAAAPGQADIDDLLDDEEPDDLLDDEEPDDLLDDDEEPDDLLDEDGDELFRDEDE